MTITLRHSFTAEQRTLIHQAVLVGRVDGLDDAEVAELALRIAEELPSLLARCGMPDNLETRSKVIDLVIDRLESPKVAPPSKGYRRFRVARR